MKVVISFKNVNEVEKDEIEDEKNHKIKVDVLDII